MEAFLESKYLLMKIIKKIIKKLLRAIINFLSKFSAGRFLYSEVLVSAMKRVYKVQHNDIELFISIPNALNEYRAKTFSSKEPETLEWIDRMPKNSIFWDIGANVGLYSCYAAKKKNCRVFSFEPSVFNLELLARNIFNNDLVKNITIVPLPLAEKLGNSTLNMTTIDWGGALSTFGKEYGVDGENMESIFKIPTLGLSMSHAVNNLNIDQPDFIKMDVDGIEHLILKGGMPILNNAKEILIEINDNFQIQSKDSSKYLKDAGFILKEKRHAEEFDTGPAEFIFNQIWTK